MTFTKTISAALAAVVLATGTLLPIASANARDYDRRGSSYGYQSDRGYSGRDYGRRDYDRRSYGYGRHDDRGYGRYSERRGHRRDKSGKYVAIGAAAAIIGLAIAAGAHNGGHRRGY